MPKHKNAASKVTSASKSKQQQISKAKKISKKVVQEADGLKEKQARKIRFKPGTVALREIKKYQKSTEMLLPHAPF